MEPFDDSFALRNEHGSITIRLKLTESNGGQRLATNPKRKATGGYRLSIVGEGPGYGGQCVDELRKIGRGMPAITALCDVWDRWHLNDMRAGTVKQMDALRNASIDRRDYYKSACAHLRAVGLLTDRGYKYGSAWLYEPLPESIVDTWKAAKAAAEAAMAERAAMLAKAADGDESDEDGDTRTAAEIIGEERDIDPELLSALADHLGIGLDEAADYHEENYRGEWNTIGAYAEEFARDIGAVNKDATWPNNHIDWEAAGNELLNQDMFMLDGGHVYVNS